MASLSRSIPFDCSKGFDRAWIIRVNPLDVFIPDPLDPFNYDEYLWLVAEALDDHARRSLKYVHNRIRNVDGDKTHADLAIILALWHRQTPFAIGYEALDLSPLHGYQMLVVFRGRLYTRTRRGALTPTGHDGLWPGRWDE